MAKDVTVTPRQMEIMRLIRDWRRQRGFSPTMQEIGDLLGLSKVTVFEHVEALVEKGLLSRGPKHKARSLRISGSFPFPDERPTLMPLVGRVAAGEPLEAIEDPQSLDLEQMFAAPGETFVLEVAGDSMIDEQIRHGDYVVCRSGRDARNGETVVAVLPDGEATLKKFYREKGRIRLQPANPSFKPIYAKEVDIRGVVVGLVRKM